MFAKSGASTQLLKLLASFLRNRQMTVKVDGRYSKKRPVNAGAPQGSVLGTYMFNIGTDKLEEGFTNNTEILTYELREGDLSFLELTASPAYLQSTPESQRHHTPLNLSPITATQPAFEFFPTARNVPPSLTNRVEPTWRPRPISVRKFVDNNLSNEKLYMKEVPTIETDEEIFRNARAGQSEAMFRHITSRSETQCLKVNTDKTTLLAVSAATSYRTKTHIYDSNNNRIDCSDTLKALSFIFNQEADISDQVESLCKRFRTRNWALRDLRKSSFTEADLLTVYKSTIRPVIEYSSVIYHPQLTSEQTHYIEKQQTLALKNIYGNEYSQRRLLELSGLPTLEQRRQDACLRFAQKVSVNPRFTHHFKKRRAGRRARHTKLFVEQNARTNRRKNSPFFYYRRALNDSITRYP